MKKSLSCLALVLCLMLVSVTAMAGDAGLLVSPTRIIFENSTRYVTVNVRNTGDAIGRYKIELVDATMDENGAIRVREDGSKDENSAISMISLSPSRMTINPNEGQVVRMLLKNNKNLPDGEYRSHLRVSMTDSNVPPEGATPDKALGVTVQTRTAMIIPVIVRQGQTSYNVTIDDAKLVTGGGDKQQIPEVKLTMSFSGNRSLVCNAKVTHVAPDGKETQLAFQGFAIYRGVAKRTHTAPLTVPEGVNIHTGRLRVDLLTQQNEGDHVLAEKDVTP
jgi:P pilus assembly chaperone PapD